MKKLAAIVLAVGMLGLTSISQAAFSFPQVPANISTSYCVWQPQSPYSGFYLMDQADGFADYYDGAHRLGVNKLVNGQWHPDGYFYIYNSGTQQWDAGSWQANYVDQGNFYDHAYCTSSVGFSDMYGEGNNYDQTYPDIPSGYLDSYTFDFAPPLGPPPVPPPDYFPQVPANVSINYCIWQPQSPYFSFYLMDQADGFADYYDGAHRLGVNKLINGQWHPDGYFYIYNLCSQQWELATWQANYVKSGNFYQHAYCTQSVGFSDMYGEGNDYNQTYPDIPSGYLDSYTFDF